MTPAASTTSAERIDEGLPDLPARRLAAMLHRGDVSAREVLAAHLERIGRTNPLVNAIVTLDPDRASERAAEADDRHAAASRHGNPAELGPLHGLPVAHKDLHATAGLRTTLGSPIFADWVPDVDALVVARARAAGAVTVGKTNTPEFGAGSQTFNAVFGATRNPWDLARTCGGSSGGAAVALACGMVPLADGSDMGGSLRNPASFCGVVGLRPSPGRVPTWPARYAWGSLSVDGPMARSVDDLAFYLAALAGPDPRCPVSIAEHPSTFAGPLGEPDLRGIRVAWSPRLGDLPVDREVLTVLDAAMSTLERQGCTVEPADPPLGGADEAFETLRAFQFELGFGALYDRHGDRMKDTVRWNVEAGRRLRGPEVARAERLRTEVFAATAAFFERYDVLACPVSQVPPFPIELEYPSAVDGRPMGSYIEWMRSCSRITVTSCPALSVPAGFTRSGLPVGLQLVGPYRAERALLRIGHSVERVLDASARRAPLHSAP